MRLCVSDLPFGISSFLRRGQHLAVVAVVVIIIIIIIIIFIIIIMHSLCSHFTSGLAA